MQSHARLSEPEFAKQLSKVLTQNSHNCHSRSLPSGKNCYNSGDKESELACEGFLGILQDLLESLGWLSMDAKDNFRNNYLIFKFHFFLKNY